MGLRTLMRTTSTLAAATVVTALLTAPSATAHVCATCEDPELPDPGGPSCPTIAASVMPSIPTPSNPKVNGEVTATTGVWNSNTKTLVVIWYAGDSPTATSVSYPSPTERTVAFTPDADDLGKPIRLYVRGVGTDNACFKGEYSQATANVGHGDAPASTVTPTITGLAKVGATLTVTDGTWLPTPDSFTYTWRWHGGTGDEDGTHRGTGSSYTLRPDDLGKRLRVEVTTVLAGHRSATATPTSDVVATGDALLRQTPPAVTGQAVYGATLTATDGTWAPAASTIERQWFRDGVPIPGAEGATYELGLADVGSTIILRTTARAHGYTPGTSTVEVGKVQRAAAPKWRGKKIRLKGKDKVKKKVKVALGAKKIRAAADAKDAKVTFQWLRNGKPIAKSTKRAHKIVKKDRKKMLKARIKIVRPGHKPLTITTKAVKIKNNGKKIR